MSGIVKALPHQGKFLQIPYVYPGLRFFFLIAGYAAGKTSALVYAVLRAVSYFSGKYDKEHKKPKIAVCGISLTFLKKTFSGALLQYLDNSKTPYSYNKADNIIETAGVQIFLIAIQDESAIFGYDCCIPGYAMVMTSKGEVRMDSIKEGDLVLTRNGYRKVTAFYDKGMKPLVRVSTPYGDLDCTEDHKIFTGLDKVKQAGELNDTDLLYMLDNSSPSVQNIRRTPATVKTLNAGELSHVYDITVEGEHEFFANGILVHNCAVFVDELDELPTSVSMSVVKALNDRARQQISGCRPPFLAFASTAQGLKGMYNTVMEFKQKGIAYAVIHGRTKDNVYLPPDYIKAMYSIYSGKEKDCYLDGRFVAVDSGLVFAQYNHAVHFLDGISLWDKLPRGQNVYLAQDFNQGAGFNKCIACTVFSGTAYIIKEYEFPDWQAAPKVFRYDFPEQNLYWIPDMTFKDNFVIASKSLRQYNIHLILKSANPLVSDRVVAVNALFHLNRLLITGDCVEVDKSVMTYQYDKKTGKPQKGSTSKAPDHYADTIGYFVYYILCFDRDFKDVFDVTINRFNRKRDRGEVYDVSGIIPKEVKGVNR